MSKCPTCGGSVSFLTASYIDIRGLDQSSVGVSYVCPKCDAILGIYPDVMTLKNDLAEILESLHRRSDDGS